MPPRRVSTVGGTLPRDAAAAVGSITPEQVRAILAVTLIGAILGLLDPNPWTKALSMVASANLIAYVGVDLCNTVVDGYLAMAAELSRARTFAAVRQAGENYGKRLGPMVARLVLMAATYGAAKAAGLFTGSSISLPGGQRAAALAEAQGFSLPAAEGAQAITLNADGSVAIHLGATASAAVASGGGARFSSNAPTGDEKAIEILRPGGKLIGETGSGPKIRIIRGARAEAEELFRRITEGGEAVTGTTIPGLEFDFWAEASSDSGWPRRAVPSRSMSKSLVSGSIRSSSFHKGAIQMPDQNGAHSTQGIQMSSEDLALLIVDALIDAGVVKKEDLERAVAITTEEIDARRGLTASGLPSDAHRLRGR